MYKLVVAAGIICLFSVSVHAADCDGQITIMNAQLKLIHTALHRQSGTRPIAPVLTGTCEQNRELLAQATYNAKVDSEVLRKAVEDPPDSTPCDVRVPRTERARGYCWRKP